MKTRCAAALRIVAGIATALGAVALIKGASIPVSNTDDQPPFVALDYPSPGAVALSSTMIADFEPVVLRGSDPVREVQLRLLEVVLTGKGVVFTSIVDRVSIPPYKVSWKDYLSYHIVVDRGIYHFQLVAIDDQGRSNSSLTNYYTSTYDGPVFAEARIYTPTDGVAFTSRQTFTLSAAALAGSGPMEFSIGTNVIANVTAKPYTIRMTNLAAGHYDLTAKLGNQRFRFFAISSGWEHRV
jgi:hypothetical protein